MTVFSTVLPDPPTKHAVAGTEGDGAVFQDIAGAVEDDPGGVGMILVPHGSSVSAVMPIDWETYWR